MPGLPNSRRRLFGISLLSLLIFAAILYTLRKIPPADRPAPAETGPSGTTP